MTAVSIWSSPRTPQSIMLFYEMTKFNKVDSTAPVVFLQTALFCKEETFCFVWYVDIQMACENGFQFCRGTLEQIRKQFEDQSSRGEITLVIEGIPQSASKQILSEEEIEAQLRSLIAAGISPSEVTSTRVSPPNSSLFSISCPYGHL
jgi:hypothetical protein